MNRTTGRSGRWVRQGSTIVVDLAEPFAPETISHEFETSEPTLRWGSQGTAVKTLQTKLSAQGFDPGAIDGIFGSHTDAAVRAFQRARGLEVDGIVGPQTWGALDRSAAPSPPPPPPKPWTPPPRGSKRDVHLNVPFRGYESNEPAGCFQRCVEMAAAVGVRVGGPDVRIQVAIRESSTGRVTIDPAKAAQGVAYLDSQLDAGHPVVVGVSYTISSWNVDDITDHFVIITGRGTDPQRGVYYPFHDPATSHEWLGSDQNTANRFYFTAAGGLYRPESTATQIHSAYDVSMVRRNL